MAMGLHQAESGCLLLADITGYTSYLQGSELEHAQDVLADLLETIVDSLEPTFTLSKLEGDAAFAYAPTISINPSMLLDTVEAAYFSFQRRLRDVVHSTTCECDACVLIPSLDLKFFVHEGRYVVRTIARSEELTGSDVVLIHRLLKGTAGKAINKKAFAVFTGATMEAMHMDPAILGFRPHTELFDDIGEVPVYIHDLAVRWAYEQERHRVFVTKDAAVMNKTLEFPAPPPMVWDYLTDPAKKAEWQSEVTGVDMVTEGRRGVGTVNHCMHGPDKIVEHVADWRPFSYITLEYDLEGHSVQIPLTYELEPHEEGTWLSARYGDPGNGIWAEIGEEWSAIMDRSGSNLVETITEQMAAAEV